MIVPWVWLTAGAVAAAIFVGNGEAHKGAVFFGWCALMWKMSILEDKFYRMLWTADRLRKERRGG